MSRIALLVCVAIFGAFAHGRKLPSAFKKCAVSKELDNKPNVCLASAVEDAVKVLSLEGAKEVGALPLDPLRINKIQIQQGESSPIAIDLLFKDTDLGGVKDLEVQEITGKLSTAKDFRFAGIGYLKKLELKGQYKIKGRVLILPIRGSGNSILTLENIKSGFELRGEPKVRKGKEYLKINSLKLNIMETSRMQMHLEDLFNGDKALSDNMNLFLNNNWQEIYSELRPAIEDAFSAVFLAYSKRILEKVPFDEIFLVQK